MQYNVLTPLKRDGSLYPPGALLELDNKDVAAALVKDGVIEEFTERPKPTLPKTQPPKADETADSTGGSEESNGSDETEGGDADEGEKALEGLSYQELQKRAADLGLKSVGVSRDDLITSIRAAEAEAGNDGEGAGDDNGDDADDL